MVNTLENLPESYGANRTILWLRAYENFDKQTNQLWEFFGLPSTNYRPTYHNLGKNFKLFKKKKICI